MGRTQGGELRQQRLKDSVETWRLPESPSVEVPRLSHLDLLFVFNSDAHPPTIPYQDISFLVKEGRKQNWWFGASRCFSSRYKQEIIVFSTCKFHISRVHLSPFSSIVSLSSNHRVDEGSLCRI